MGTGKNRTIAVTLIILAATAIFLTVTVISSKRKSVSLSDHVEEEHGEEDEEHEAEGNTTGLHALAISHWGTYLKTSRNGEAEVANGKMQMSVAHLLSLSAENLQPKVILNHGGNFYRNGVKKIDRDHRFQQSFEEVYHQSAVVNIPWFSIVGKPDYGGGWYICGIDESVSRPCKSVKEVVQALNAKFSLQKTYKSPQNDRWVLPDRFYKRRLTDEHSGVTVDIFNIENTAADSSEANDICCQCAAYSDGEPQLCAGVSRGQKLCFGGHTDMYDACVDQFSKWTKDTYERFLKEAEGSDATWKIANAHDSFYGRMNEQSTNAWLGAIKKAKIQLVLDGSTPSEKHDFGSFNCHFITNGGGGGVKTATSRNLSPAAIKAGIQNVWESPDRSYGMYELSFEKDSLKVNFVTFNTDWQFEDAVVFGSGKSAHCWEIPHDGSKGESCDHD
uniref:Uncharacterized protein AlNc14C252G9670 n=1 Tax=Albugo laibachii Nc14 TaxID=890382 RepID=F0WTJ1_9STRA|nr:conserved hypothetical protein [Albugo laibachii Nc14]|eukprot:CCA24682.1 conserved hypothetical protein [Albugo laibachii Nc14]